MTISAIETHYRNHPLLTGFDYFIDLPMYDKNAQEFYVKQDAYLDHLECVIEFKAHDLNSKTSIKACSNKLYAQAKFRGLNPDTTCHNRLSALLWKHNFRTDCLTHAWNHSLHKHVITAHALHSKLNLNYLVVFDKLKPQVKGIPSKVYYQAKGLTVISKREFDLLLKDVQAGMSKDDIGKKYALPFI